MFSNEKLRMLIRSQALYPVELRSRDGNGIQACTGRGNGFERRGDGAGRIVAANPRYKVGASRSRFRESACEREAH